MARSWLVIALMALTAQHADSKTYKVTPNSSPSLQDVMAMTKAGDVVELGNGVYTGGIRSSTSGTEDSPITVTGSREAVVSGTNPDDDRVITIKHSYIHLRGFTVDGKMGSEDSLEFYADKCIYVHGQEVPKKINYMGHEFSSTINGLVLSNLSIKNCQGECVRLRYFVTHADIQDNDVQNCGVDDFIFNPGKGKNGEGFYIGTSSEQWEDGKNPNSNPDGSSFNLVRNNIILTNGNECVEVKEGTEHNVIEGNTCGGQLDAESGCFGSRGDKSIFRFNKGDGCDGAGVRVGGHMEYGIDNKIYENSFTNMGAGSVKIMAEPQAEICGNICSKGDCTVVGAEAFGADWDQPCPSTIGSDLMPYGGVGEQGGGGGGVVPQDDDVGVPVDDDSTGRPGDDDNSVAPADDDQSVVPGGDDDHSLPCDDDDKTTPGDDDKTVPEDDDKAMPEDDDKTKSEDDEKIMPEDDDKTKSEDDDKIKPEDDDKTKPKDDDTSMPEDDDKTMPENDDKTKPEDDDTSMQVDDDKVMPGDDDGSTTILTEDDSTSDTNGKSEDAMFPASCTPVKIKKSFLLQGKTTLPDYPVTNLIDGDLSTMWSTEGDSSKMRVNLDAKTPLAGVFIAFPHKKPQTFEITGDDQKVLVSKRASSGADGLEFFSFESIVETSTINLFGFGDSTDAIISFSGLELCGAAGTAVGTDDEAAGKYRRRLRGSD
ncbi:unnamed protein product [Choristocarpus tenellus]